MTSLGFLASHLCGEDAPNRSGRAREGKSLKFCDATGWFDTDL
jgi:hypothetical protein